MKNTFLIPIAFLLSTTCLWAQIDKERMERDIEVAENILATLTKPDRGDGLISYVNHNPYEGTYVDGYGVIFSSSGRFSAVYVSGEKTAYTINRSGSGSMVVARAEASRAEAASNVNKDSIRSAVDNQWIEKVKIFLADYAHLINQLQPTDKIMVTNGPTALTGQRNYQIRFAGTTSDSNSKIEVSKQAIADLQSGKISREDFMKSVKVEVKKHGEEVAKDIELVASIFQTLYKQDMSETYYCSGNVYAEKIDDLGVILQMKVYSSTSEGELHRLVTQNKSGLSQEERNKEVKELYPKFVESLKSNLVQYGRTVKSLKPDEKLMLHVLLTQCNGCGIPESVELSITASVLSEYNAGKLSEKQAIDKIKFEETGSQ